MLAIAFVAEAAAAQSTPQVSQPIHSVLRPGDIIWVNVRTGDILKGQVFGVSATGLKLLRNRRLTEIGVDDIRTIQLRYRDPVTNGVRKGLVLGLYAGATCAVTSYAVACHDGAFCPHPAPVLGVSLAFGAITGAAVGWMVDALRTSGREVWRGAGVTSRVIVVPTAGPGLAGASVVISW
jgi:hypothetical protein